MTYKDELQDLLGLQKTYNSLVVTTLHERQTIMGLVPALQNDIRTIYNMIDDNKTKYR